MAKYVVETIATAEIRETWEVTASSVDEAADLVLKGEGDHKHDWVDGEERDREIFDVYKSRA